MNHLNEIFTTFDDALINHIPENIDTENPEKFFTYYYEHFSLSTYDVFSRATLVQSEGRYTAPLYVYISGEMKEYEEKHGKIEDMDKKWMLMHLMVLSKCSESYSMTFMHNTSKRIIENLKDTDITFLIYYVNHLNMALMSESGVALVPRPTEIARTNIDRAQGFTPFFNEVLQSIAGSREIFKRKLKDDQIKGLENYIDCTFMEYMGKHDILAEYFSGLIILKRDIIVKKDDDSDEKLSLKMQMLSDEIDKFINNCCEIDDEEKINLKSELIGLIDTLEV